MLSVPQMAQVTEAELKAIQSGLEDIRAGRTTEVDVDNLWGSIL